MNRKNLWNVLSTLQMVRGPLKIPRRRSVKNLCTVCGGPIPKGRHYTCSVGCKIDSCG